MKQGVEAMLDSKDMRRLRSGDVETRDETLILAFVESLSLKVTEANVANVSEQALRIELHTRSI